MALQEIELFTGLSRVDRARLFGSMEHLELSAGSLIFEDGDDGDSMFIINSGKVEIFTETAEGNKHSLVILPAGEIFGEMALLTGNPRSASAMALTDAVLFKMDIATFNDLITENHSIATYLLRLLCQRLGQTNINLQNYKNQKKEDVNLFLNELSAQMKQAFLFSVYLPICTLRILEKYFKLPSIYQSLDTANDLQQAIFTYDKNNEIIKLDAMAKKELMNLFSVEYTLEEKDDFIRFAVKDYVAHQDIVNAVNCYTENECWDEAIILLQETKKQLLESEEEWQQIIPQLEECPDSYLFRYYDVFNLLLKHYFTANPEIGMERLESALNHIHLFKKDQVAQLYNTAAEFSKALNHQQRAIEYLNMALNYSSQGEIDEEISVTVDSTEYQINQERDYHLAKQKFENDRQVAMAKKEGNLFKKGRIIHIITVILAILCIWYFSQAAPYAGLSKEAMFFIGVSLAAVIFWVVDMVPNYVVALVMAMIWVVGGIVPSEVALSGFSTSIWLFMVFILALSVAISKSGLLFRLALHTLKIFPKNYGGQLFGLAISGIMFNPLVPSAIAKVTLAPPIAQSISESMGFQNRSKGSAGLGLAAMIFYGFLYPFFLTGTYGNVLALGLTTDTPVSWFQWFFFALPALLIFVTGMYASIYFIFKPDTTPKPLSVEVLNVQLNILGKLTKDEKLTILITLGSILMFMLEPWHQIESTWIMLVAFTFLILGGVLDTNSVKSGIDWSFLLFIGIAFSFAEAASQLGVVDVMADILGVYMQPLMHSPYVFLIAVVGISFLVSLIVRDDPAMIMLVIALAPLASSMGMHPWVLIFVLLISLSPFFFSFQSPIYLTAYYSTGGKAFSHKQGKILSICFTIVVLVTIIMCIPLWKMFGLIT
jgi:anion transporter